MKAVVNKLHEKIILDQVYHPSVRSYYMKRDEKTKRSSRVLYCTNTEGLFIKKIKGYNQYVYHCPECNKDFDVDGFSEPKNKYPRRRNIQKELEKMWKCKIKGKRVKRIIKDEKSGYYQFHFETGQVFSVRGEVCEGWLPERWERL